MSDTAGLGDIGDLDDSVAALGADDEDDEGVDDDSVFVADDGDVDDGSEEGPAWPALELSFWRIKSLANCEITFC